MVHASVGFLLVSFMLFSFISTNRSLSLLNYVKITLLYICVSVEQKCLANQCLYEDFNSASIIKICMVKLHGSLAV